MMIMMSMMIMMTINDDDNDNYDYDGKRSEGSDRCTELTEQSLQS